MTKCSSLKRTLLLVGLLSAPVLALGNPISNSVRVELDVKFDFGKATLEPASIGAIRSLAEYMRQHPEARITVSGHADSIGSAAYNQALSERRAMAVREALIREGVNAERVEAVGRGHGSPAAENGSEAGRRLNRRVEGFITVGR